MHHREIREHFAKMNFENGPIDFEIELEQD